MTSASDTCQSRAAWFEPNVNTATPGWQPSKYRRLHHQLAASLLLELLQGLLQVRIEEPVPPSNVFSGFRRQVRYA